MKPIPYIAAIVLLVCSCSAEKRLNKLLRNHPEFTRTDTITVVDTVFVNRIQADIVSVLVPGDTLYMDRDRLHVKVVKLPGDSIYVQGVCDADTFMVTNTVFVDKVLPTKTINKAPWYLWMLVIILAAGVLLMIVRNLFGR